MANKACQNTFNRVKTDWNAMIAAGERLKHANARLFAINAYSRTSSRKQRRKAEVAIDSAQSAWFAAQKKFQRSEKVLTSCMKRK